MHHISCLCVCESSIYCAPSSLLPGFPECSEASHEPPVSPGSSQYSAKRWLRTGFHTEQTSDRSTLFRCNISWIKSHLRATKPRRKWRCYGDDSYFYVIYSYLIFVRFGMHKCINCNNNKNKETNTNLLWIFLHLTQIFGPALWQIWGVSLFNH